MWAISKIAPRSTPPRLPDVRGKVKNRWFAICRFPKALALCLFLCAACSSACSLSLSSEVESELDSGFHIYILAGQSNMAGRAPVAQLPAGFPANQSRLFAFKSSGRWEPAVEPIHEDDPRVGVGPGVAFANAMAENYKSALIGVIPCAVGGTKIDDWRRNMDEASLYGACLARYKKSAALGALRGVLWFQGESDTHSFSSAEAWPGKFVKLVADLRADLGYPGLPLVFAQLAGISDEMRVEWDTPAWDRLKQLQAGVSIPGAVMIKTDDLSMMDGLHLSTLGSIAAGERFAGAMIGLLQKPPKLMVKAP